MPEYREQVTEVITPKFATDFEKRGRASPSRRGAGRLRPRPPRCSASGVQSIDDDSATVLVAGDVHDQRIPTRKAPERRAKRVDAATHVSAGVDLVRPTASGWSTTTRR